MDNNNHKIKVLDKQTINQIAAGEVIERPASVVKELIENSIDAGATAVSCEIRGGGTDLIRITDNGCGIPAEEVRTAFLRHATSKIQDAGDLTSVLSLGFRGEALASIAAVAEVELLTRVRGCVDGTRYLIAGGEEQLCEPVGCPEGTTFIIRNLFLNVPARRKFLKSATTEASFVSDLVERIALSHPEVSIKFINNSRTTIFTSGSNEAKDIIYGIYGREITSALAPVEFTTEDDSITVSGYIAKPVVARSSRSLEHYFVNGRYIRNNIVSKAVETAFAPYLMQHKFPFTVLHISILPETMDVNVHPAKQEVRFAEPDKVYTAVYTAVSQALRQALLIPKADTPKVDSVKQAREELAKDREKQLAPEPFENVRRMSEVNTSTVSKPAVKISVTDMPVAEIPAAEILSAEIPSAEIPSAGTPVIDIPAVNIPASKPVNVETTAGKNKVNEKPIAMHMYGDGEESAQYTSFKQLVLETDAAAEVPVIREETKEEFKKGLNDGYKIVGQVFNTYWVVERGNTMYLIDQHAAHEKVIYERLVRESEGDTVASQNISPSMILSFSANECDVIERHKEDLQNMGYTLESFGGREYSVSAVPVQLYSLDPAALLQEIIDSFTQLDLNAPKESVSLKERLATCSCKAAVKGNTRISTAEAESLIEQLLQLDNPFNCPHGRPIIISMTKQELEKKFKRII